MSPEHELERYEATEAQEVVRLLRTTRPAEREGRVPPHVDAKVLAAVKGQLAHGRRFARFEPLRQLVPVPALAAVLLLSLTLNAWLGYRAFTPHPVDEPSGVSSDPSMTLEVPPGTPAPLTMALPPWRQGPRLDMPLLYRPPLWSTGDRVVSRTAQRGREGASLRLTVIAPDHTGLSVQELPFLYYYWSIEKAATSPVDVEFTIMEDPGLPPLVKTRLGPPGQPGWQRVRLATHGLPLSAGVRYEWFVTLITDPDNRATNLTAGGAMQVIGWPSWLLPQLTQASAADAPRIYAWAGVWYDAFNAVADLLEATPNDPELLKQRTALLEQVRVPGFSLP